MNKVDILIGIPSYNEEDSIRNVVQKIDLGLTKYFPRYKSLIVNMDSNSEDKTKTVFLDTLTKTQKYFISGGKSPRGKGINIIKLLQLAKKFDAKYICTFDADLMSISEKWPELLLRPIIKRKADFTVPIYTRNRYEGNTTNHFCYPLITIWFGRIIRQPIAGEFGMNRKFVNYILKQKIPHDAKFYGIDVFLTIHAIGGGLKIKQIFLGRKIHKSSFEKISLIFPQVAITTIHALSQYPRRKILIEKGELEKKQKWVDKFIRKPNYKKVEDLYNRSLKDLSCLSKVEIEEKLGIPYSEIKRILNKKNKVDSDFWVKIISLIVKYISENYINRKHAEELVKLITPLFFLRVITFFSELEERNEDFSENIINNQTKNLIKLIT